MATTDSNGILFYEDTDIISPLNTLLNTGQTSVSTALSATARVFPVADVTERDALAVTYSPAADNPLIVFRADAISGRQIEYTIDGSTWIVVMDRPPIAQITKSSAQNTTAGTYSAVIFDVETYDDDEFHSASPYPWRLTCPTGLSGYYRINAKAACITGTTYFITEIRKNGTQIPGSVCSTPATGTGNLRVPSSIITSLTAGDYIELFTTASAVVAMVPGDCLFEVEYVRPI
jgi:hypothetical protein